MPPSQSSPYFSRVARNKIRTCGVNSRESLSLSSNANFPIISSTVFVLGMLAGKENVGWVVIIIYKRDRVWGQSKSSGESTFL